MPLSSAGQGGIHLIFRFGKNMDDVAADLFHFAVVVFGELLQHDRRAVSVGERRFDLSAGAAVGKFRLSAAVFRRDDETAAVGHGRTGERAFDLFRAALRPVFYDDVVSVGREGECFQIADLIAGPIDAGVLHAPPGAFPLPHPAARMPAAAAAAKRMERRDFFIGTSRFCMNCGVERKFYSSLYNKRRLLGTAPRRKEYGSVFRRFLKFLYKLKNTYAFMKGKKKDALKTAKKRDIRDFMV